jgi:hypothetical protein
MSQESAATNRLLPSAVQRFERLAMGPWAMATVGAACPLEWPMRATAGQGKDHLRWAQARSRRLVKTVYCQGRVRSGRGVLLTRQPGWEVSTRAK